MLTTLYWYLAVSLIGLVTFPLTYRLLPALPDRGYAISKALGLLMWGFIFWLLSSFGVLANDPGGIFFAFILLAGLGLWSWRGLDKGEITNWLRENRRLIWTIEILFAIAFVGWVIVRAAGPAIDATEKPMELAFISAAMRAPFMPPHDPWLSGYAISYYYFGYVLTAMLANISGATVGVAFNLAISLVFALTAIGAYGIVYNLLALYWPKGGGRNVTLALLSPVFMLLVSNTEGFLEVLHAGGVGWSEAESGALTSDFWEWLDIENLRDPPAQPFELEPRGFNEPGWWWWRASRVIQDYDFVGNDQEIINEFPMFSFVLGDLHPHVLVMPFAFIGLALALNLFMGGNPGQTRILRWQFEIHPLSMLLGAVVFGGLAFLSIWEFPVQVGLFAAAYALRQAQQHGWEWTRLREFLSLGLTLGIGGILLYFPYFVGFSSQAGGVLPTLLYPTRGAQLWVMWGTLWLPIFAYLIYLWRKHGDASKLLKGVLTSIGIVILLWVISIGLASFITITLPAFGDTLAQPAENLLISTNPILARIGERLTNLAALMREASGAYLGSVAAPNLNELLDEALTRRLNNSGGWITLTVLLTLILGLLWKSESNEDVTIKDTEEPVSPSHKFAILLALFGTMLVLVPEFIYLRDLFGYRINTIFKFYYQAWLFWAMVAAFGSAILLINLQRIWRFLFSTLLITVLFAGLTYTVFGILDRTDGFKPVSSFVLDGTTNAGYITGDDAAAAEWLRTAPLEVLVEAISQSYHPGGRISAISGQSSLLGWPRHETQWRGGSVEMGTREMDIQQLYQTSDWLIAQQILEVYDIRYVYVGQLERSTYFLNEGKFIQFLTPVYQQGSVTIYEVP